MANTVERQIVRDGARNACVKWTGILDTSDFSLAPAIALGELVGSDQNLVCVGLRVMSMQVLTTPELILELAWNGSSPQLVAAVTNQNSLADVFCGGFSPDRARAGYDGALNLKSVGYRPGTKASFALVVEMAKIYR